MERGWFPRAVLPGDGLRAAPVQDNRPDRTRGLLVRRSSEGKNFLTYQFRDKPRFLLRQAALQIPPQCGFFAYGFLKLAFCGNSAGVFRRMGKCSKLKFHRSTFEARPKPRRLASTRYFAVSFVGDILQSASKDSVAEHRTSPSCWPASTLKRSALANVQHLVLAYVITIAPFQFGENNRGQDGESAQREERFMDPVNHFPRLRMLACGNEKCGGQPR
jgi:hypothetical protein